MWNLFIYLCIGALLAGMLHHIMATSKSKRSIEQKIFTALVVFLFWPFLILFALGKKLGKQPKNDQEKSK